MVSNPSYKFIDFNRTQFLNAAIPMLLIELGISKLSVNDLQSWNACALILVNFASFANFTHFKLSQLKNADSLISIRSLGIVIVPMILIQSLKALAPKKVKFSDKVT